MATISWQVCLSTYELSWVFCNGKIEILISYTRFNICENTFGITKFDLVLIVFKHIVWTNFYYVASFFWEKRETKRTNKRQTNESRRTFEK